MHARPFARLVSFVLTLPVFAFAACSSAHRHASGPPSAAPSSIAPERAEADALFAAGRFAEAVDAYRARVAVAPDDAQAWHHYGYSLHVLGRLDEAIEAHRRASAFPSHRAPSLYNLACAYSLKSEPNAAFAALDQALAAGFRDAKLLSTDSDLASLRSDARFAPLLERARGEASDRQREFDFWIGEWDVFDPSGVQVGSNVITKEERGRLLHERWTDRRGGTGQSLNFVDPADGRWRQVWVDDRGTVIRYSGGLEDGALVFEGELANGPGPAAPSRCTFTPQPDGTVRQVIEQRDANGAWQVAFDGRYVRKST